MPHYELDDYVQEHPDDDSVNANCVASWCADCIGGPTLRVDLHNSWIFDSRSWRGPRRRAGEDTVRVAGEMNRARQCYAPRSVDATRPVTAT